MIVDDVKVIVDDVKMIVDVGVMKVVDNDVIVVVVLSV